MLSQTYTMNSSLFILLYNSDIFSFQKTYMIISSLPISLLHNYIIKNIYDEFIIVHFTLYTILELF